MRYAIQFVLAIVFVCGIFADVCAQSTWTIRKSGTQELSCVLWADSTLFTIADDSLLTSSDGVTWIEKPFVGELAYSVAYTGLFNSSKPGSGKLVAVGEVGTIETSPDAVTWTSQTSNQTQFLLSVIWTGSQLVAVGLKGTILTSPDGITWTTRSSGTMNDLTSVTLTGSLLVAVGRTGTVLTSSDGVTWASHSLGTTDTLNAVTWTGNQLVAVGNKGAVKTSTDGVTWTSRVLGTSDTLNAVTWSGNQLVAVGNNGAIRTSLDGITWTSHASGTTNQLRAVTSTNKQVIAVGRNGTILTSSLDAVSVAPRLRMRSEMLLRQTLSQLFAALPNSMLDQSIRSTIYSLSGNKMVEVNKPAFNGEVAIPIQNLSRGVYLLKVSGANSQIVQPFSIAQ